MPITQTVLKEQRDVTREIAGYLIQSGRITRIVPDNTYANQIAFNAAFGKGGLCLNISAGPLNMEVWKRQYGLVIGADLQVASSGLYNHMAISSGRDNLVSQFISDYCNKSGAGSRLSFGKIVPLSESAITQYGCVYTDNPADVLLLALVIPQILKVEKGSSCPTVNRNALSRCARTLHNLRMTDRSWNQNQANISLSTAGTGALLP